MYKQVTFLLFLLFFCRDYGFCHEPMAINDTWQTQLKSWASMEEQTLKDFAWNLAILEPFALEESDHLNFSSNDKVLAASRSVAEQMPADFWAYTYELILERYNGAMEDKSRWEHRPDYDPSAFEETLLLSKEAMFFWYLVFVELEGDKRIEAIDRLPEDIKEIGLIMPPDTRALPVRSLVLDILMWTEEIYSVGTDLFDNDNEVLPDYAELGILSFEPEVLEQEPLLALPNHLDFLVETLRRNGNYRDEDLDLLPLSNRDKYLSRLAPINNKINEPPKNDVNRELERDFARASSSALSSIKIRLDQISQGLAIVEGQHTDSLVLINRLDVYVRNAKALIFQLNIAYHEQLNDLRLLVDLKPLLPDEK